MPDDGVYDDEVCAGDTPILFHSAAERERARQLLEIDTYCFDMEKDPVRRNRLYGQLIRKLDKENE
jgi:hypothetical protein